VPFAWFTADEVYGQAKWLQVWRDADMISYTLPKIRRLLISLIQPAHPTLKASGPRPAGAGDASIRPGYANCRQCGYLFT
jgi:hypothetical protein